MTLTTNTRMRTNLDYLFVLKLKPANFMETFNNSPKLLDILLNGNTQQQDLFDMLDYYNRASTIIERTYIAMGKVKTHKITTNSTINVKLNFNAFASTY